VVTEQANKNKQIYLLPSCKLIVGVKVIEEVRMSFLLTLLEKSCPSSFQVSPT